MLLNLRNIFFKIVSITFGLVISSSVYSQYTYIGKIENAITGKPVEHVTIVHKKLGEQIQSDKNGAFIWNFGELSENPKFRIVNNVFYSPETENISLQLYNLKGQKLVETNKIGMGGTYLFPNLTDGIYLLSVNNSTKKNTFKLISSNKKIILSQNTELPKKINSSIERDTLSFSKSEFYNTQLTFPQTDTSFRIPLFPKVNGNFDYFLSIPNYEVYSLLQSNPTISNQGEVESVKFIYDENENRIYFMNTKRHDWHFVFAEQFLGYDKGHYHFNATQYTNSSERYLFPGSINFYKSINKYVLRFYPGDEMGCNKIEEIYHRILALSYLQNKLFLYSNNTEWQKCANVPQISSDEIFKGQNYQALNLSEGFGYLRKIEIENLNSTYLGKHDIVLLNGIPNDVSVVAGIITTEFQTPLSHINILSHNRKTPNMALRDGWTNSKIETLLGELVYLEVQADSFILRKANLEEATSFWNKNEPQSTVSLEKDITVSGLINLNQEGINSVNIIGGKAANFAELLKVQHPKIPTPENPFAIPFFYYNQHIQNNKIDEIIHQLLSDETFQTNQDYRKEKLSQLRNLIVESPINPDLADLVRQKINDFANFKAYRFRSSTNAEDLDFFSGAGLYDSFSAKAEHETKTIENAIKKVWASLWNFRAFEEREYYKIDHNSVAMGILVHRSFPDEDANGVLITKNLYNINPGFIINVQFKEYSIVFPETGILHDQIILFTYSLDNSRNFTIEYLSHSNIPDFEGQNVLSDSELYEIGSYCMKIKEHYFYNLPHNCNCLFNDFGLDIEFKIDSPNEKRQIYIKQVRPFN